MIMKTVFIPITLLLLLTGNILCAQTRFITDGTIEFEKTVNMYAMLTKLLDKDNEFYYRPMFDQYKKTQPQFKILKSNLSFSLDKTLYEPVRSTETKSGMIAWFDPLIEQNNTIYTDLSVGRITNQKAVFEQTFLVKDSTRKITWKITDETRDIAGYTCRRANGIMLDSIYVVAFYTIAIPVSGGPESFSGLPGMILGVALPHENITWFAKKVNDKPIPALKVPAKGKVVSNKELKTTLSSAVKNWGKEGVIYLKAFSL
jgi:GLPGLI family protein